METNKFNMVEASKQFAVPREKLYAAWNDPAQLKQWWKPMGNKLKEVENECKPGGTIAYTFENDTLLISGTYEDVKENEQLSYTWNWKFPHDPVKDASYKLTVKFRSNDNGSEIHVTQENNQNNETLQPNEDGWEKGLSDLADFLGGDQSQNNKQEQNPASSAESAGYGETPAQQKVGGG